MQFRRHFLLLLYKLRYKRTICSTAKLQLSFQKINIETKLCYPQIGVFSRVFKLNFHKKDRDRISRSIAYWITSFVTTSLREGRIASSHYST